MVTYAAARMKVSKAHSTKRLYSTVRTRDKMCMAMAAGGCLAGGGLRRGKVSPMCCSRCMKAGATHLVVAGWLESCSSSERKEAEEQKVS